MLRLEAWMTGREEAGLIGSSAFEPLTCVVLLAREPGGACEFSSGPVPQSAGE